MVVAEFLSGTVEGFAERMNNRARELNMTDTNFKNPMGLMKKATIPQLWTWRSCQGMRPQFQICLTTLESTRPLSGEENELTNFNSLVYLYDGADGLKTGMTSKSGYFGHGQAGDSRFIVVLMDSTPDQRLNDA